MSEALIDKYLPYQKDLDFMERYINAQNAATGSEVDPNSNVSGHNMATMAPEIHKRENLMSNRLKMYQRISELYGSELAEEYLRQLEHHEIYRHDESLPIGTPYCVATTLYPFLTHGTKILNGDSEAPRNLDSFCGSFINLVFAIAGQFAGAVATPEFIPYFTKFCIVEWGNDFHLHPDAVVELGLKSRTIRDIIHQRFQQIVYSLNSPSGNRGAQSVFWNVAYFDKPYFDSLFQTFYFPDGTKMTDIYEQVDFIQHEFMNWLCNERATKAILTFPVESFSLLNDGTDFIDQRSADFVAEMHAKGHSFFIYTSDSVDSLSSCCRLRNSIDLEKNTFSYTLGAGGIATGSKCVMTINLNRLVQNALRGSEEKSLSEKLAIIKRAVDSQVRKVHKYLLAFESILQEMLKRHMLPVYEAGFISLDKQYLTVGINGLCEGAEFIGIKISDNPEYKQYIQTILETISNADREDAKPGIKFNCEMVPAENLGVKNAKWDKADGYFVPRDCYNSYVYLVEDNDTSPLEKFRLHGEDYTGYCDGGSALHCNLSDHLTKDQYTMLMKYAIKHKVSYFTYNIPMSECKKCKHISQHFITKCPKCGSEEIDYATRVIGYLTRVSKWSADRQAEWKKRYYAKGIGND